MEDLKLLLRVLHKIYMYSYVHCFLCEFCARCLTLTLFRTMFWLANIINELYHVVVADLILQDLWRKKTCCKIGQRTKNTCRDGLTVRAVCSSKAGGAAAGVADARSRVAVAGQARYCTQAMRVTSYKIVIRVLHGVILVLTHACPNSSPTKRT